MPPRFCCNAIPNVRSCRGPTRHAVPTLRLTPEIVSVIDYSKGFGHSDLFSVGDDDLAEFIEARRHHWAGFHAA